MVCYRQWHFAQCGMCTVGIHIATKAAERPEEVVPDLLCQANILGVDLVTLRGTSIPQRRSQRWLGAIGQ